MIPPGFASVTSAIQSRVVLVSRRYRMFSTRVIYLDVFPIAPTFFRLIGLTVVVSPVIPATDETLISINARASAASVASTTCCSVHPPLQRFTHSPSVIMTREQCSVGGC